MAEITDSIKETNSQNKLPNPKTVRDALLRLRQLAANLPPIDAAAVIREIRETGSQTI
jgi:hypothetical protein